MERRYLGVIKIHYYHSGAVMALVGNGPNLILDYEMYNLGIDSKRKDEGELNVSKRLLSKVVEKHNSFVDIVTYDALACNSKFVNHCIELDVDAIIRVKKNNNNSIKQVKKLVNKKEKEEVWETENERIEVYEAVFYMKGVVKPLKFVKYAKKNSAKQRSQILIITT